MAINSVRQKGRPRMPQNVKDPRVSLAVRRSTHRSLTQLKRRIQKERGVVCTTEVTFDDVIAWLLANQK